MEYDIDQIQRVVDKAVRDDGDETRPTFYAISGSHLYGFPSEDGGDVDVRGFHLSDGERYMLLDEPAEQIIVNQDGVTSGYEEYAEIDLVSYELKKFASLLYEANFNVLEVVFDGTEVMNSVPLEMAALRQLIENQLPLDVPRSYVGMAKTNYRTYLDQNRDSYEPTAKTYLYVLRGLLGARYVLDERTITADVRELSAHVLGDTELVEELIEVKRERATSLVEDDLGERADEQITRLFDQIDPPKSAEKDDYRSELNGWMRKVRA